MPQDKRRLVAVALAGSVFLAVRANAQTIPGDTSITRQTQADAALAAESILATNLSFNCRPFLVDAKLSVAAPFQASVRSTYGASEFPADGADFVVLANGDPDRPGEISDIDIGQGFCRDDQAILELTFDFSGSDISALSFRYDFLTYEFPEFVGSVFSDYVQAFLDGAPLALSPICDATPAEGGCAVALDADGAMTNVNSPFLELCSDIGCDAADQTPGWEAEFTQTPGDDSGRTGTLTACTPLSCDGSTGGIHTLTLIVSDASDGRFSSAALFDDLRCVRDALCQAPIVSKCADGTLGAGEDCDDGNRNPGDGCSAACTSEALQCPPTTRCNQVIDFEGLPAGTHLGEVFSAAGVGPITISAFNPLLPGENAAVVFDSSCPGGCSGNDPDLGTPNEEFAGPGVGAGGSAAGEAPNDRGLGMIAIVAKDLIDDNGDGLIDDPDDQGAQHSTFEIDFSSVGSVTVSELTIIDVEDHERAAEIEFVQADDSVAGIIVLPKTGGNGAATAFFSDAPSAAKVRVSVFGSAGIDELRFTIDSCLQSCALSCGDANGTGAVTATDAVLVLRFAVGAKGKCETSLCDADSDGKVTASDALRVLRMAVAQVSTGRRCGQN